MSESHRKRLRANFFVNPLGTITSKAKPLTYTERTVIFNRDEYKCQECNVEVRFFGRYPPNFFTRIDKLGHVDHVFPRSKGGQNNTQNLRLLCEYCNSSKGAR